MFAGKAAVAATAAWFIGRALPGGVAEYAYYAPFGAVVVMTPTVASSLGSAVKTLVGVALGLAAAWALVLLGFGGAIALPLAVGVGTLLAGVPWLGAARDWVPLAAIFAFLVGGTDKEDFSLGFIGHLAVGAALGILINLVLPPPLGAARAAKTVDLVGDNMARCFNDVASALADSDTSAGKTWNEELGGLETTSADARAVLTDVAKARRGNVRTRRAGNDTEVAERDLRCYEQIIQQMREMSLPLADAAHAMADTDAAPSRNDATVKTSAALKSVADVVLARREQSPDVSDRAEDASEAIREFEQIADRASSAPSDLQRVVVIAYALRRIVAVAASDREAEDDAPRG